MKTLALALTLFCSAAYAQSIQIIGGDISVRENDTANFAVYFNDFPVGGPNLAIAVDVSYFAEANASDVGPTGPTYTPYDAYSGRIRVPINVGGGNEGDERFRVIVDVVNYATVLPASRVVTILGTNYLNRGDANRDGAFENGTYFTSLDIVQVLAQGKYLTGLPAGWWQGDFNGDGQFNQLDLIGL